MDPERTCRCERFTPAACRCRAGCTARTCEVLQGAENRTGVTFTVTPVEQWHWDRALIASAAEVFDELEVPE